MDLINRPTDPKDAKCKCMAGFPLPQCGEPPCVDAGTAVTPETQAALCAALAGQTLASAADPAIEAAAAAEWDTDAATKEQFMRAGWQTGSGNDEAVDLPTARARFMLERTRDVRTNGWRKCSVAAGGYVTGTVAP